MPGNSAPDEEDIDLFRHSVGEVKPLRQDKVLPSRAKPKPQPLQRQADERQVLVEMSLSWPEGSDTETGEELLFKRTGIQNSVLRKLRRGQFSVEDELDLHGMTLVTAASALSKFLAECGERRLRCVRIIHGKGKGSKDGRPVIKQRLDRWLRQRENILAFCSARPVDGGTGAIYVLIKRN